MMFSVMNCHVAVTNVGQLIVMAEWKLTGGNRDKHLDLVSEDTHQCELVTEEAVLEMIITDGALPF